MNPLAKMLAAKKGNADAPTTDAPAAPATQAESAPAAADTSNDSPADAPATPAQGGLAFLKNKAQPATIPATSAAPTPAPAAVSKGLGFLAGRPSPTPAPAPAASSPKLAPAQAATPDLQALMDAESHVTATATRFSDLVAADAPIRELPEDATDNMRQFVDTLDTVYRVIHEPDMLGNTVRSVMQELAEHPEYRKLIQPKDMNTMVRGMRDSMGLARIKKEESKSKRSGSGAKKSGTLKADTVEALALLDSMGFGDE